MYLECSGTGSPTVVLISGKGNGAADWSEVLDPADPEHHADYDAVAWGKGNLHKSDSAVFPMVSRFTRVCAYDRPGTRLAGPDQSTPVAQPHPVDQAADDLHRLLTAAGEPGPYVLVPHSYGGLVATHFARTWPEDVDGLVMVDTVTELMRQVASPEAVAKWDEINRRSVPEAPEAVMLIDAFAKIDAASPLRELPAVVLRADKPWQPPSAQKESDPVGGVTFADWERRRSCSRRHSTPNSSRRRTAVTTSMPIRRSSSSMPFARSSTMCGATSSELRARRRARASASAQWLTSKHHSVRRLGAKRGIPRCRSRSRTEGLSSIRASGNLSSTAKSSSRF
jgi:pimeloyl-ACP methyl ester carboxylesterase